MFIWVKNSPSCFPGQIDEKICALLGDEFENSRVQLAVLQGYLGLGVKQTLIGELWMVAVDER